MNEKIRDILENLVVATRELAGLSSFPKSTLDDFTPLIRELDKAEDEIQELQSPTDDSELEDVIRAYYYEQYGGTHTQEEDDGMVELAQAITDAGYVKRSSLTIDREKIKKVLEKDIDKNMQTYIRHIMTGNWQILKDGFADAISEDCIKEKEKDNEY